jgi:hypothetical protein
METIFDELKQHIIKEITDTVILERSEYPNLIEKKKYLIVYYHHKNPQKIKMVEYAGRLSNISPCYPGAYGDLGEGIYFYGISKELTDSIYSTSYCITGQYNCFRTQNNLSNKFYELEYSFSENDILNIYSHVRLNYELDDYNFDIEIFSSKKSICIYSLDIKNLINLDSDSDSDSDSNANK